MRAHAKSYISRYAGKSRLFRSVYIRCTSVSCKSRITGTTYAHRSRARSRARTRLCAFVRGFSPVSELSDNGEQFGMRVRCGRRWARRVVPRRVYMPLPTLRRYMGRQSARARRLIRFLRDLSGLQGVHGCVPMNLTVHERYTRAGVFAKLRWYTHKY